MNNLFARLVAITSTVGLVSGQISEGGTPYSYSNDFADSIATVNMISVDVAALLAEDDLER